MASDWRSEAASRSVEHAWHEWAVVPMRRGADCRLLAAGAKRDRRGVAKRGEVTNAQVV